MYWWGLGEDWLYGVEKKSKNSVLPNWGLVQKIAIIGFHKPVSEIQHTQKICMLDLLVYEGIMVWILKHNTLTQTPHLGFVGISVFLKYQYPCFGVKHIPPTSMWDLPKGSKSCYTAHYDNSWAVRWYGRVLKPCSRLTPIPLIHTTSIVSPDCRIQGDLW